MMAASLIGVMFSGEDVQEMPAQAMVRRSKGRRLKRFMAPVVYGLG